MPQRATGEQSDWLLLFEIKNRDDYRYNAARQVIAPYHHSIGDTRPTKRIPS
jgi:hypothetical protein